MRQKICKLFHLFLGKLLAGPDTSAGTAGSTSNAGDTVKPDFWDKIRFADTIGYENFSCSKFSAAAGLHPTFNMHVLRDGAVGDSHCEMLIWICAKYVLVTAFILRILVSGFLQVLLTAVQLQGCGLMQREGRRC
ncbi:hypothetical protein RQN30_04295 [Arcanobacterium hippocoleae]